MGEQRYMTLMASLPYHGRLFGARQTPLSRFQLNQRLTWLDPVDRETLELIENVLRWRTILMDVSDEDYLRSAHELVATLSNELITELVWTRLEMRTVVAALRMRNAGRVAPPEDAAWGFGRWVGPIRRHWTETGFSLDRIYPWVTDAARLTEARDAMGLERLLLKHAWAHLARMGAGHYFDFEAVVAYVLRWDLVERWIHRDGVAARSRFNELTRQGLDACQQLFH